MHYKVNFTYFDKETVDVNIKPEEIERFMACIGKSQVYFNQEAGTGMWVPIDKIRYFTVNLLGKEDAKEDPVQRDELPEPTPDAKAEDIDVN